MIRALILILFISCASIFNLDAQTNYVLNPSFEIYTTCPVVANHINYAIYWDNADSIGAACGPYYCNECVPPGGNSAIPAGYGGVNGQYYHYPRTGKGLAFSVIYSDITNGFIRTYLRGELTRNLISGQSYCVTYYVTLTQGSVYAVNHIGAYLDDGSLETDVTGNAGCSITGSYTPQVTENLAIIDTTGWNISITQMPSLVFAADSSLYDRTWVKIQGSFVANGSEKYITIANYDSNDRVDTVRIQAEAPASGAIYLFDDVSVVASDAVADAGPDVVISLGDSIWIGNDTAAVGGGAGMPCWWYILTGGGLGLNAIDSGGRILVHPDTTTKYIMMMDLCGNFTYDTVTVNVWPAGLIHLQMSQLNNLTISPNPAKDHVAVNGINKNISYQLTNVLGQEITIGILKAVNSIIDLSDYLPGIYLLTLEDPDDGTKVVKRVVKE